MLFSRRFNWQGIDPGRHGVAFALHTAVRRTLTDSMTRSQAPVRTRA